MKLPKVRAKLAEEMNLGGKKVFSWMDGWVGGGKSHLKDCLQQKTRTCFFIEFIALSLLKDKKENRNFNQMFNQTEVFNKVF